MLDELIKERDLLEDALKHKYRYSLNELSKFNRRLLELDDVIEYHTGEKVVVDDEICVVHSSFSYDEFFGDYYIYSNESKRQVGRLTLLPMEMSGIWRCNLGYDVYPEYQNKGFCTKAVCALLTYLKENKFPFVQINVEEHNAPSLKVASKVGKQFKMYKKQESRICRHLVVLDEKSFSKYLKYIQADNVNVDEENSAGLDCLGVGGSSFKTHNYIGESGYLVNNI